MILSLSNCSKRWIKKYRRYGGKNHEQESFPVLGADRRFDCFSASNKSLGGRLRRDRMNASRKKDVDGAGRNLTSKVVTPTKGHHSGMDTQRERHCTVFLKTRRFDHGRREGRSFQII